MGSWQKSTLHTKIKTFKNCLLSLQKLKNDSLNKKSNCLFVEAMLFKASFFARTKFINELALDYFIVLKSENFDFQYPRISV